MLLAWRGSDYYARRVFRRPHSFPPSSFFSLQTSYIFMRVLCCMSIRPSVHPSRLSICTSVSPSIRARNTRACSGTRACERVLRRRAQIRTFDAHVYSVHTYVCMCVYVCVCVYTHTHTHVYVRRESASIASLSVSEHATHDIRRWGPCGHLISGDMRARASLLIVRPLARLRSHVCQR